MKTDALTAACGTSAASITAMCMDHWVMPLFGTGMTTLGMAAAGAMLSLAWADRTKRSTQVLQTIAATFIGAAAVTAIPAIFHVVDVAPAAQPVVGFFYALFGRWAMPVLKDLVPALFRKWFNLPQEAKQ